MSDIPEFLLNGPKRNASATIVLAHGAGAPMDSEFMNVVTQGLANEKFNVVRFEFPYMAERREKGTKKPPNTAKILQETWLAVIKKLKPKGLIIGGKSMGGRVASMIADTADVAGCVCLGYPFHPPGKPEKLRTEHLESMKTPTLILQGERDAFGTKEEVKKYKLARRVKLAWLQDGEHSFKPRKSSGVTHEENLAMAVKSICEFVLKLKKA